jgi:endonuclease III
MDNLCIDFKQKQVKYELDQRRTNILRTNNGSIGKYSLDAETMKKLRLIVEARTNKEEGVNEKVENLQAEVKKLKSILRVQHEEMKKLIHECLQPQEK